MKTTASLPKMKKSELITGWIYVPIHIFALSYIISLLQSAVLSGKGLSLDTASFNLVYYAFGAVFLLIFMFGFLKTSFGVLWDNVLHVLKFILFAYLLYYAMVLVVNLGLSFVLKNLINPNSQLIINETKLNPNMMTAIAVLLAPFVEEILFRGVVFGTIRSKSRILAYAASIVLFSVYHLWQYALGGFSWTLLLYMVQYIPGAIALAWCYEKSGTIWAPIFLHMIINYISLSISVG